MNDGREQDFEKVFGRDGIWSDFLRRSAGFVASFLREELSAGRRRYKVFDCWKSHEDFERCRQERQQEIEGFKLLIGHEGLVARETFLGSFYMSGPDEGGLVLR
ncbi:MAG TPA: hypothetical protein VIB39_04550 [Candidatus Angelobacter sp.]